MITKAPTGTAKLTLTITTQVKRGKHTVPLVVTYNVTDLRPDRRVANPAFRLTKKTDGECYDIAVEQHGPTCSCPHATYRGANSEVPCKHILAAQVVGLLPVVDNRVKGYREP